MLLKSFLILENADDIITIKIFGHAAIDIVK